MSKDRRLGRGLAALLGTPPEGEWAGDPAGSQPDDVHGGAPAAPVARPRLYQDSAAAAAEQAASAP
ncbi:MAG: hypothetical protein J5I93_28755, partial [Pirellulaceae bacterium]|nr:hypothetical protein [Pirellulaceae bacterium]